MRAALPSGARNRRFTLERAIETPDGFGGVLRSYQPGPRLWGSLALVAEQERQGPGRPESEVTHRVTCPFREDLVPPARLALGSRLFRIRRAEDPDGRRRAVVCLVEEIAP